LEFNPHKRIGVVDALGHPYLAGLHRPSHEVECKVAFDFEFEKIDMTKKILQDFIWEEVYFYRPHLRAPGTAKRTDKYFAEMREKEEKRKKAKDAAAAKRKTLEAARMERKASAQNPVPATGLERKVSMGPGAGLSGAVASVAGAVAAAAGVPPTLTASASGGGSRLAPPVAGAGGSSGAGAPMGAMDISPKPSGAGAAGGSSDMVMSPVAKKN